MTTELVDDRVYRLDLGIVNAYLVDDGETTLIDAGTPTATDDLRAALEDAGYGERDLDRVLLTHFDVDHVGTLADLAFDGPIHAAEPDASFLDGSRTPPVSNRKGAFQRVANLFLTRPSAPVRRVADGASVGEFDAYHTPGHTPGHTVPRGARRGVPGRSRGRTRRLAHHPAVAAHAGSRRERGQYPCARRRRPRLRSRRDGTRRAARDRRQRRPPRPGPPAGRGVSARGHRRVALRGRPPAALTSIFVAVPVLRSRTHNRIRRITWV